MLKPIALVLLTCLAFAGCGVFQSSPTWSKVRAVRVDVRGEGDPSAAFAARLSERLTSEGIEHQVVTYQFRYRNRMSEETIATRTAVVYRDDATPRYPWWLMDERLSHPFWLPSGDLAHQISFYIRKPVELVETQSSSSERSGKTMAAPAREGTTFTRAGSFRTSRAIAFRIAPSSRASSGPRLRVRDTEIALQEKKRAWLRSRVASAMPPRKSAKASRSVEGANTRSSAFRAVHGTTFDPRSATDRRKLEQLRQSGRRMASAF